MAFGLGKFIFGEESDFSWRNFIFGEPEEPEDDRNWSYADLFDLNKPLQFALSKDAVGDPKEFKPLCSEALKLLEADCKRFGKRFAIVSAVMVPNLTGIIGSMTIIADNAGEITVKFHKRLENGLWDGSSKKFPEKDTTGIQKHEVFFVFGDED